MTDEIQRTWLIQRLNPPFRSDHPIFGGKDNPFAFGGGLLNGGLSSEAMDLLRDHLEFDYMGAAEYEWGDVPRAFQKVLDFAKAGTLTAAIAKVPLSKVPEGYSEAFERKKRGDRKKPLRGDARVYLLCPEAWVDEISRRVILWGTTTGFGDRDRDDQVRDDPRLQEVLRYLAVPTSTEYPPRCRGWLELNNGFMFFTDHAMFAGVADLFGVDASEVILREASESETVTKARERR